MTAGEAWLWGFFLSLCEKMGSKQLPLSLGGWLSLGLWYEGMPEFELATRNASVPQ